MKITDWAIVFVIIIVPLFWIVDLHAEDLQEVSGLQITYTSALRTAVQDAGSELNINEEQRFESGYRSNKMMRADKEQALAALLHTLSLNMGIENDELAKQGLMLYIPAVVVIDYDGYYVYAVDSYTDQVGNVISEHRWRPKKPYVYIDRDGNSMAFTLDHFVTVHETSTDQWVSGLREDLASEVSIPLLQDRDTFEEVRRQSIVHSIENQLSERIHSHNVYARQLGVSYTFTLPVIPHEEWNNSLDDVGILVFLQGIPVGDSYYNNYALGGGRLEKRDPVIGYNDSINGVKYFSRAGCIQSSLFKAVEIFANERDAAASGYFESPCIK